MSAAFFEDIKEIEMLELDGLALIWRYCEDKAYEVEGFPFQKRILAESTKEYDDDYFCFRRYLKYICILAMTHNDVLELMWCYETIFAPDFYKSKDELVTLKEDLDDNTILLIFKHIF